MHTAGCRRMVQVPPNFQAHTNMHTALTLTLAAAIGIGLPGVGHAAPTDSDSAQRRSVGAFSAIDVSGPYDVVVDAQGRPGLVLSGERARFDEVETVVRGGTLFVRPVSRSSIHFSFGKQQAVTVRIGAPRLTSLSMAGSGDVVLEQADGERLTLEVSGPGDLKASGAVRELVVRASGSGDADLQHLRAGAVDLALSGPGDVHLAAIDRQLDARLSGSGDLTALALDVRSATLSLSGPGDAQLAGKAATFKAQSNGSGDIDGAGLAVVNATIKSSGPGDVELAQVGDTLEAELRGPGGLKSGISGQRLLLDVSGPGDAEISGRVALVRARLSGPGTLSGRRLVAERADIAVTGPGKATVQERGKDSHERLLVVERGGSRMAE